MRTVLACALTVAVICAVVSLVSGGCGGGGGSSTSVPPLDVVAQKAFRFDFLHNTVEIIDAPTVDTALVEPNPGAAGAEVVLSMRIAPEGISQPGNLGRRHIFAKLQNLSSGALGGTDSVGSSALELNFTSTVFKTAANVVVPGGGFARVDAFDPVTGTPVYLFSGPLGVGATSGERQVDLWLPPTATQAIVTGIVRALSERYTPPSLDRFWVSTSAGNQGQYGWVDGLPWVALFGTHATMQGLVFRENTADTFICDPANNRLRYMGWNPVTKKPEVFTAAGDGSSTTLNEPVDTCVDALGNVYVSEHSGHCVDLYSLGAGSGSASAIAGQRNSAGNAVGTGNVARLSKPWGIGAGINALYVCDQDGSTIRKITTTQPGSTYGWNYQVSAVSTTGLTKPMDIAVDALENIYVSDAGAKKVFICLRRTTVWKAIAGGGANVDGTGAQASFKTLGSIVVDTGGVVWVVDNGGLRRLYCTGGAMDANTNWRVDTVPLIANSTADGPDGKAGRRQIRGVTVARGGVIGFTDDGAVRRLDMTPK